MLLRLAFFFACLALLALAAEDYYKVGGALYTLSTAHITIANAIIVASRTQEECHRPRDQEGIQKS
jgi:hypothetical protein